MADLGEGIVAIELLVAAQAVDVRGSSPLGGGTGAAHALLRGVIPTMSAGDTPPVDVEPIRDLIRSGPSRDEGRRSPRRRAAAFSPHATPRLGPLSSYPCPETCAHRLAPSGAACVSWAGYSTSAEEPDGHPLDARQRSGRPGGLGGRRAGRRGISRHAQHGDRHQPCALRRRVRRMVDQREGRLRGGVRGRDGRRPRPDGDEERGRQRRGRSADQLGLHRRQRRARRVPRRRSRHGQRHDRAGRPLLRPHEQHADARAGGQPGVLRVRQARLRDERGVRRAGDGAPEHPDGAPEEHRPLRRRGRGRRRQRRRPGRPDAAYAGAPAAGPQDREVLPAAQVLAAAAPQPARARRAAVRVRRGERGLRRPGAGRARRRTGAAAGRRHGEDRRGLRRGGVPAAPRRRCPAPPSSSSA